MTEQKEKPAPPPPILSEELFGGRKPEEALDTPSKVRCALARVAFMVADGKIPGKLTGSLLHAINSAGMQNNSEAELGLRGREIAAAELSARELARRNDLREQALRLVNAQRLPAGSGPAIQGSGSLDSDFESELRRLAREEEEI